MGVNEEVLLKQLLKVQKSKVRYKYDRKTLPEKQEKLKALFLQMISEGEEVKSEKVDVKDIVRQFNLLIERYGFDKVLKFLQTGKFTRGETVRKKQAYQLAEKWKERVMNLVGEAK